MTRPAANSAEAASEFLALDTSLLGTGYS